MVSEEVITHDHSNQDYSNSGKETMTSLNTETQLGAYDERKLLQLLSDMQEKVWTYLLDKKIEVILFIKQKAYI